MPDPDQPPTPDSTPPPPDESTSSTSPRKRRRERGPDYHAPHSAYGESPGYGQPYGAPPGYGGYGYEGVPYYGGYGEPGPGGGLTPQRVLRILRRQWLPILLVTALGAAGTFFYLKRATPIFQATSMIEITLRSPRIAESVYKDEGSYWRYDEEFNTRLQKMRGSSMKERFVEQYRELYPEAPESEAVLQGLLGNIEIKRLRETDIVTFALEHADAELAMRAVNAYARAAEVEAFRQNKDLSDGAVAWLQEQAEAQHKLVAQAEAGQLEYRAKYHVDVLESERKAVEASLMTLNQLLVDLESRMVMLQDVSEMLETAKYSSKQVTSLPEDLPGRDEIATAHLQTQAAIAARDALLARYTENHPKVIALADETKVAHAQFIEAIKRADRTVAASLALKREQIASIHGKVDQETQRASDLEIEIVKRNSELTSLGRELTAREIAYNGILNRIEEARLSADEKTATVKVLERAEIPEYPIRPSVRKILPVGLLLGLLAGFGIGFLSDQFDDRLTSAADIEQGLGLQVLGVVPRIPKAERSEIALASLTSKFGQIPEVFAGVRGLLDAPNLAEASQVVLVASSAPEEGKTICASNLAITYARSKQRALLIDFDLRRPRIAKIYSDAVEAAGGDPKHHSLLHILAEGDPDRFPDLPLTGPCENLDVVTSESSRTHSPADVIGGRSVRDFIDWAREHYDRIIIDSAPLGVISDASVLAGIADCVIVVCRPQRTRRRIVRHAIQQFRNIGANMAGLIVNDVDLRKGRFSGDYHYRYHQYAYQQAYQTPESQ